MPRPLRESPPTSAVARLLDVGAAARAVATTVVSAPEAMISVPPTTAAPQSGNRGLGCSSFVKREFVLTPATEQSLTHLIDGIRRETGARVSASHVLRALLLAAEHAKANIETEARCIGPLKLPCNARGRESERAAFERRIAAALVAGMRSAAALDPLP